MPYPECLFTTPPTCVKGVMVCQNRTCRKQGAARVIAAFQATAIDQVVVLPSGCLGQCGNGPMVRVVPDEVWYARVHPDEVPAVIERHLLGGRPIVAMLYRKFHSRSHANPNHNESGDESR